MITLRKAKDRGHAEFDWLVTDHTFSFASYYDPAFKGFSVLRVINEDKIAPGRGFDTHHHDDMEIITCVLSGKLQHRDSLGHSTIIQPAELQRMSAGTGVDHSEFNPDPQTPTHLYQIWIRPDKKGHHPSYEQKAFPVILSQPTLVASHDGRDGSLKIHQDASLYLLRDEKAGRADFAARAERRYWLQVLTGTVDVLGEKLSASDGAAIELETKLSLHWSGGSQVLIFDLP